MPGTFSTETPRCIPHDSVILRAMEQQQNFGVPIRPRHENHVCCSPILQNPIWAPDSSYIQPRPNGIHAAHDLLQVALWGQNGSSTTCPSIVQSREHSSTARTATERSSSCSSMSSQKHRSTMDYSSISPNCPEALSEQVIRPTLSLPALKDKLGKKVGHH